MLIEVTGIVEDGGVPSPTLPANPRQGIVMTLGTSLTVRVAVVTRSGVPAPAKNGSAQLSISFNPFQSPPLVKKAGVANDRVGPNVWDFVFSPADLRPLGGAGIFAWDCWFTDADDNRNPVVPVSQWQVLPAATPPV